VFQRNGNTATCPHCGKTSQHRAADVIKHDYPKPED